RRLRRRRRRLQRRQATRTRRRRRDDRLRVGAVARAVRDAHRATRATPPRREGGTAVRPYVQHWLEGYLRADVADLVTPSWFMCAGIAGLVTLVLMLALGKRRGFDSGTLASTVLWCYVAAVAAGIVVPMLIDSVEHLVTAQRLRLKWSGMTSFWGYLAGAG